MNPEAAFINLPSGYETDLAMISVKSASTQQAIEKLAGVSFDTVVSLQNGLDKYDVLEAAYGAEKPLGMFSLCFGTVIQDGKISAAKVGKTYIGEIRGGISERARRIARVFEQGGLPVELTEDILSCEWSK